MGVKSLCWIAVFFAVLAAVRPLQPPPDPDEERDAVREMTLIINVKLITKNN